MSQEDLTPSIATDSVTDWLVRLKAGDSVAAQKLWQRYVARLIRLAHGKLLERPRRMADEEDVVLTAFHALLDGVEQERFTRLDDRDDLWQILVMLTERKAIGLLRREQAAKRGGGQVRGESALDVPPCAEHRGTRNRPIAGSRADSPVRSSSTRRIIPFAASAR